MNPHPSADVLGRGKVPRPNVKGGVNWMKSLDELKDEVFRNLSKCPKIEAFFKDSLEERIKLDDNWIENALVHNILAGITGDHPLMELIKALCEDKENFEILKNKLNPKDDYDMKTHDVLAELDGYYHLKKFRFQKIIALQEDNKQKRPDFSAEMNGQKYLFEVKNMRAPVDIEFILRDKCYARRFMYPESYSNMQFESTNSTQIFNKATDWLKKVFESIESSRNSILDRLQPFEEKFNCRVFHIGCNLMESDVPMVLSHVDRVLEISDPLTKKKFLDPFEKKVKEKVTIGLEQLREFDRDDSCWKYVLLHWEKSSDHAMFFNEECLTVVQNENVSVKKISENLFVKLLNTDSLP